MLIRKTTTADIAEITEIYEQAKRALKADGVDQWQNGYPNEESLKSDIENNMSYVVVEENGNISEIVGTAALAFGIEPTYNKVFDGGWTTNEPYGFIHRVAVSEKFKGRGIVASLFAELERQAKKKNVHSLRIDTHRQNLSMQKAVSKNSYKHIGIIYLPDGAERLAFEKLI